MSPSESRLPLPGITLLTALATLATALVFAVSASAGENRRLSVHHADLDLSVAADVVELERRVTAAAEAVCRRPGYSNETVIGFRSCVADAVARAQPMIRNARARGTTDTARVASGIALTAR